MESRELLKCLGKLGFPLFDVDEEIRPNETIAEVVKSNNIRLWEGFPVIFANANKEHLFNLESTEKLLKEKEEFNTFIQLIVMSFSLYKFFNLKFTWERELLKDIGLRGNNRFNEFLSSFKGNNEFQLSEKHLDPKRIKEIFNNYFVMDREIKKMDGVHDELSLEYALSQIFTPKQKEIFLKRLQGKKLTKTEREYFYRIVKKKAMALANSDLQRLAQQVIR